MNFTITGNSNTVTTCYAGNLCSTFVANNTIQGGPKLVTQTAINSPLKQFKSEIPSTDVKCDDGFLLTFKADDGYPACIKPDTKIQSLKIGWAVYDHFFVTVK